MTVGATVPPRRAAAVGIVLAGGESSRMGRDKARLPWGSGTLLEHAVLLLAQHVDRVLIASGPGPRYGDLAGPLGAREVSDLRPAGTGPLAGLEAALAAAAEHQGGGAGALCLPCDLVGLEGDVLVDLAESARARGLDLLTLCDPGGSQPLMGFFGPRCLAAVRAALDLGRRRADSLRGFPGPDGRPLAWDEYTLDGAALRSAGNLNTPEEYAAARRGLEPLPTGRPSAQRPVSAGEVCP